MKKASLSKAINRINGMSIRISKNFFIDIKKLIFNFIGKPKFARISKAEE